MALCSFVSWNCYGYSRPLQHIGLGESLDVSSKNKVQHNDILLNPHSELIWHDARPQEDNLESNSCSCCNVFFEYNLLGREYDIDGVCDQLSSDL